MEMITNRLNFSQDSLPDDSFECDENSPIVKKGTSSRKKSYKKWTQEEDDRLREYIASHNDVRDWSSISKYVGNNRTEAQCQHRWERFLDPSITKGPWTDEEDKKVIQLVRNYGAKHWSLIAKELKGRVGKQCRERWHNHLNPLINKNPWTNEENLRLFILHQHFGNRWAEIAKYFNGRSDNSIKNHWNSSMKKRFHLEVENLKKQGLDWTALIPSDFQWPKIDQSISTHSTRSSRAPLNTITNQLSDSNASKRNKSSTEISAPILNSNNNGPFYDENNFDLMSTMYSDQLQSITSCPPQISNDLLQHSSSQNVENILYCSHSTSSDYTHLNETTHSNDDHLSLFHSQPSIDHYSSSHMPSKSPTTLAPLSTDMNLFTNTLSPTKYYLFETPERPHLIRLTPSPKQDCFNEYLLPLPESVISENHSLICLDKYDLSPDIPETTEYNPSYTEIVIGQTPDQRYMTEQARRYLSCSSLDCS